MTQRSLANTSLAAAAVSIVLGCSSAPKRPTMDALAHPGTLIAPQDSTLELLTVSSPLDTLEIEIPDISDSSAALTSERVPEDEVTYDVPIDLNVRVLTFIDRYSGEQSEWFARSLRRSGRVMPMIQRIFAEEGVPRDLAYMAMVESAYRHNARSRAGAIGMWQFMRGTAKQYGLACNGFVDERLDPERATRAAARHLRDLHEELGDWYLAMAAYNAGGGRVRRAIRRSGSRNFWEISKTRHLVRETRNYVPAILAAIIVSKSPEKFGFHIEPEPPLEYDTAEVESVTHLDVVAQCCDVPPSVIRALNPALLAFQTPPGRHPYEVRVPKGTTETFLAKLADVPPEDRVLYVRHRVRGGETLSTLAHRYGTTISMIQEANAMGHRTMIRVGQTLVMPNGGDPGLALASLAGRGERVMHRVRRGQTLSSIARAYGTTVRAVQVWNDIPNPNRLKVGQSLTIWAGVLTASPSNHTAMVTGEGGGAKTASDAPSGNLLAHTVRRGDTLWSVARAYGMTVRELRSQNPKLGRSNVIRPGDRLAVAARGGSALERVTHHVRRGETLWTIADRYNTTVSQLRLWNGLGRRDDLIRPGDSLTLYR